MLPRERVRGRTLEARLVAGMAIGGPNDCWLWQRSVSAGDGYPKMTVGRRTCSVHRLVCELVHGGAPEGAEAMHSCDVPVCCNPRHLSWGSRSQNRRDMVRRGRSTFGERNASAKLSEADARLIAASALPLAIVAERFRVAFPTVSQIRSGKRWRHITAPSHEYVVQLDLFER